MSRMLLVLCVSLSFTIAAQTSDFLLQRLDSTLEQIDALEEYGPPPNLHGLEQYIRVIDEYRLKTALTLEETTLVEGIFERLFSRYAYRDGSQRSRIFAEAQKRALNLLDSTMLGKKILQKQAQKSPLINMYLETLT